jgi:aspartate carbamoyltransferase regulatory subunit
LPVLTTIHAPWQSIKKFNAGWVIDKINPDLEMTITKILKLKKNNFFLKSKNALRLSNKYRWSLIFNKYIKTYKSLLNP